MSDRLEESRQASRKAGEGGETVRRIRDTRARGGRTLPIVEIDYGEPVERGHCKCCCEKWHPVKIPRSPYRMRRHYGPRFKLYWEPSYRCSCQPSHRGTKG